MADGDHTSSSASPQPELPQVRSQSLWLVLGAVLLLAGGTAVAIWWPGPNRSKQPDDKPTESTPLDGKLSVTIRPPGQFQQSHVVGEAGEFPARHGGTMSLDAQFEQPACAYFVWLDCQGQ